MNDNVKESLEPKINSSTNSLTAITVVLLLASLLVNFFLYTKLKSTQDESLEISSNYDLLLSELQLQNEMSKEKDRLTSIAMKSGNHIVSLQGQAISPEASAMVIWNSEDKTTYIKVMKISIPSEEKQFQLWAYIDGKPVNAGVFVVGNGELPLQALKHINRPQYFSITLENKGGSDAPSGPIYLLGTL